MPSARVELLRGNEVVKTWTQDDVNALNAGDANCDLENVFEANVAEEEIFRLRVTWVDNGDSAAQTKLATAQTNCSLSLYIKGTQHVDSANEPVI